MSLRENNLRLVEENKVLASLLKMKVRTSNGDKETYLKLDSLIAKLLELESRAHGQTEYYEKLEHEVVMLRKTCEKFSEVSESLKILHAKHKQQISDLTLESAGKNEIITNIRIFLSYFL